MTKKSASAPKKMGRPSSFSEKLANRIIDLAKTGKTDKEIADKIGISLTTLSNWKSNFPDFLEALKGSKNVADQMVVASLFQRAIGYSYATVKFVSTKQGVEAMDYIEHCPPDVTACIFWLKNRQRKAWRDASKQDDHGDVSKPIPLAYVPKSQREKVS